MTLPEGWLDSADIRALEVLAFGNTVLELGAWKGRSTVVLAGVANYVVSVDRHQGVEEQGGDDSLPDYLAAVRDLPNVAVVLAPFEKFVLLLSARGRFDLVFIDGDHDYASVQRDTYLALALNAKVVAFHDWDIPAVRDGASAILGEPTGLGGSVAHFKRT